MNLYNTLKKLRLEEKAVTTNWILFITSWAIYFNIIVGAFPLFIILISPFLGVILPNLYRIIKKKLQKYKIIAKDSGQNDVSTAINTDKDDLMTATSKFFLHSFINLYVLVTTIKILILAYGFSPATFIGIGFTIFISMIMLPIVVKESISLCKVSYKDNKHHDHKVNYKILAISFIISAIIATLVFMLLAYCTNLSITLLPLAYPSMLIITPIVTAEFLILVTYLIYIYSDHKDIKINHWSVVNNVLAFIGVTFSLIFGIYKIACLSTAINTSSLLILPTLPAIGMATFMFILPIIFIFSLATLAFLFHKDNIYKDDGLQINNNPCIEKDRLRIPKRASFSVLSQENDMCIKRSSSESNLTGTKYGKIT